MSESQSGEQSRVADARARRGRNLVNGRSLSAPTNPWIHGTSFGRTHANLRRHMLEDHGASPAEMASFSDGALMGEHDHRHQRTWAHAYQLAHEGADR